MKFILYRDPSSKIQKIPYAAMQAAELADAEKLLLYAGTGCVLLCKTEVSAHVALKTIAQLNEMADFLVLQLVDASNEIVSTADVSDPLDHVDEDVLNDLLNCGANPDGLRMLLAQEDEEIEE
ncbi:hypothetical protein [Intestinimonas massiliensis (ex Afouda et al. 2020)]|uniref:hypothetical protein n=1 Tax=Intestinimonas massiliensis (ex Afouda et al. 2020) TaxID=1673721 RepID=UPI0010320249|nr:hypothetical protein [Intestinimonas massiliensis (ex Afouda et al. 2020)]